MQTLADFYTKRNVEFLRQWIQLRKEGVKTREIANIISERNEVSRGCVHAVYYDKSYPYAAQAWAIIEKEEREGKREAEPAAG